MRNPFKKTPKSIYDLDLTRFSPEQLKALVEGGALSEAKRPIGDGKAVFLDDGYADEAKEIKQTEDGTRPWYKRIGL